MSKAVKYKDTRTYNWGKLRRRDPETTAEITEFSIYCRMYELGLIPEDLLDNVHEFIDAPDFSHIPLVPGWARLVREYRRTPEYQKYVRQRRIVKFILIPVLCLIAVMLFTHRWMIGSEMVTDTFGWLVLLFILETGCWL